MRYRAKHSLRMSRTPSVRHHAETVRPRPARRGTAMIVAIVCLLLITTICFSLVRHARLAVQQVDRQGWRAQAAWLAESGLLQAAARLQADPDFAGGEWTVDHVNDTPANGHIAVTVTPRDDNNGSRMISVTANFPVDDVDRVRTTRTLVVSSSAIDPPANN